METIYINEIGTAVYKPVLLEYGMEKYYEKQCHYKKEGCMYQIRFTDGKTDKVYPSDLNFGK